MSKRKTRPPSGDGGAPGGADSGSRAGSDGPLPIGEQFARITAPRQLNDPKKRKDWGLPEDEVSRGPYIIELNLRNIGGLPGAANVFLTLFKEEVRDPARGEKPPDPMPISKTYYRCELSVKEWRRLLDADDRRARELAGSVEDSDRYRSIFRLWPDFPVKVQLYRSIPTIKADAALRSFDAAGDGIVWAVFDSGIQGDHPHFGGVRADSDPALSDHTLLSKDVRDLHRCFVAVADPKDPAGKRRPLSDPDANPKMDEEERARLVAAHREAALTDPNGHGTHVAGIIAGQAPADRGRVRCFERQYHVDAKSERVDSRFLVRPMDRPEWLRGVAPRCKLISLRVLDDSGEGRSSDIIRALEYLRERINDGTQWLRVHGVNLSVGYEYDPEMFACGQSPICIAVERLVQIGLVVVAAAGNTGFGTVAADIRSARVGLPNTINDPGNAASAITVGSTHPEKPYTYGVSYFSSKGPTGDGRPKPDLVAPGERIISCAAGKKLRDAIAKAGVAKGPDPTTTAPVPAAVGLRPAVDSPSAAATPPSVELPNADYIEDTGTSMAAPHVSGAVAAFLSIRREFIGKPVEVKRIFLESASPLGRERYFEGHGLIDLMRAIQSV